MRKLNNVIFEQVRPDCAVPSQKKARGMKFWLLEGEELYCPCSQIKGFDQLCRYCTADLHPCFCLYILVGFLMRWLIYCIVATKQVAAGCLFQHYFPLIGFKCL